MDYFFLGFLELIEFPILGLLMLFVNIKICADNFGAILDHNFDS